MWTLDNDWTKFSFMISGNFVHVVVKILCKKKKDPQNFHPEFCFILKVWDPYFRSNENPHKCPPSHTTVTLGPWGAFVHVGPQAPRAAQGAAPAWRGWGTCCPSTFQRHSKKNDLTKSFLLAPKNLHFLILTVATGGELWSGFFPPAGGQSGTYGLAFSDCFRLTRAHGTGDS